MAWRPNQELIEGELDNTKPGKVTGWMRFAGLEGKVTFDLNGDFHRDIRGMLIRFRGKGKMREDFPRSMEGFAHLQTGEVGDITAGLQPQDYVDYPYIEWYSDTNGRVCIELDHHQIEFTGDLLPL